MKFCHLPTPNGIQVKNDRGGKHHTNGDSQRMDEIPKNQVSRNEYQEDKGPNKCKDVGQSCSFLFQAIGELVYAKVK